MSTTAANFRRAGEVFQAAARLDLQAREPFIIEQSGGDAELLAQLRALLRADQLPPGVLDQPALGDSISVAEVESTVRSARELPDRIGHYRIVRVIGEGGMGVVYEAEQDEPRRRVALKVIRPGMMSASLLRRFRHEAQMLGQLKHPGIAQIYEAGTADQGEGGQPYFAMELVTGRPLLDYAQAHRLGTRQRLELMARICDAVHHAHLNGVIHRDLKPVNILVVDESSQTQILQSQAFAQPKILDFGIARATEADIQTVTLRTDVGHLLGTIAYMSPEQAAGDPAQLDIRSDVYALGVIAYELLSGRLPYNVQGKLIHEAVRIIRDDEPSRLSSISRVFRGDVETIIAKALEKEKDRRYQSAAEFASDIRRYLSEQPIAARPASRLYQFRKFARRNKAIVAGVAVAFAALAIGTAVSITQAIVARAAAADARRQTYRASLVAASSALRYHETSDAQRHLDAAPEELRGWEWDHLSSRLDDSLMLLNLDLGPQCFAVSPDGHMVASASSGGHIRVWRVPEPTPTTSHNLTGSAHERRVTRLLFSADGRELRADTRAGSVLLDAQTLAQIARDDQAFLERSDDNRFGAAVRIGEERRLVVVESAIGREVFGLSCRDGLDSVIEFSPDGELAAICLRDRGLTIHRTSNGQLLCHRPQLDQIMDLAFSADGSRLALASMNGAVAVIDSQTGSERASMVGHAVSATAIAFGPDESLIATASGDRTVRLWRAGDGSPVSIMHGNQSTVVDLAFTPDGSMVVTASEDRMIRWWDAERSCDPFVMRTPGTVYGVAFSPDGQRIVAACLGGGERPLRVWDASTGAEIVAAGEGYLSALAISSDGVQFAAGRSGRRSTSILT
ncbi:MAG: serine/threonine protein kinase, partial [Phycisphaerales bacterium]|nr:serine/threonine protein kinase [Phycisphaerales bacterium]